MRTRSSAVVLAGLTLLACSAPDVPAAQRIEADIGYLADDAREGRGVGTAGLDSAARYVARAFEEAGLDAPNGSYFQSFAIDSSAPAAAEAGVGGTEVANIVGVLPGTGDLAGEAVVVGAHYDHLGRGHIGGSLEPDREGEIHNGADDNASGTVALLEVARRLSRRHPDDARTVVFVAFTAEELGLIGSAYYAEHPVMDNRSTYAMVNMDMVGRLRGRRLAAFGAESATEFPALLDSVNAAHRLDIAASGDGFGRSDHQSFFIKKIPVLHLFTGTHDNYHATGDDAETINIDGLDQVAGYVTDLVAVLRTRTTPLTFVDAAPPRETTGGGERAYLGTIPDMTSSPGGVRLSGVTPGSPADDAGMQEGDILVGIGEYEVGDLFDMTNALVENRPGDRVTLRFRRGDELLERTVTLRSRGG